MTNTTITPIHTIRPAGAVDAADVAFTLAEAFRDDPVFAWCLPDPARRSEVLPSFFRLVTDTVVAYQEVAVTADGQAAALWVPPGCPAVPAPHAGAFEAGVADLVGDDGERTFALMAMLDEFHPTEPNRFLWFVGTRSTAQGEGRGSALLRDMLARCDAEGTAAYLDATSEHNRRLYERHGFEVVDSHSVDGSPPLWPMWREPRTTG